MGLKINGSTSGSIEIDVPAVAGTDTSITIPAKNGGTFIVEESTGNIDLGPLDINGSASDDSVVIDGSGRLLVGTSSAVETSSESLIQAVSGTGAYYIAARNDLSTGSTNSIGGMRFYGNDSDGNYDECARIECLADGLNHSDTSKPSRLSLWTTAQSQSSPTERMRINNNGISSLYGDTTVLEPRSGAAASGSTELIYCTRSATNVTNGTGVFAVYTNGSYATLSDQTRKKNIETTRDGYLDDLNRLRVVKYNWNEQEDGDAKELGLIAQEVEQVFPGLISEMSSVDEEAEEETSTKSIKYSVLPVMLLKALQEADQKIEAQAAQLASQAATIAALDARLTALEGGAS